MLKIEGFKSIRKLDLELGQVNILIGPNGAGKSNLVSYFYMLREMVEERLQVWVGKQGGANRLLTYGAKRTPQLVSRLQFGDNAYEIALQPTVTDRFIFTDERLNYREQYPHDFSISRGHLESRLRSELQPDNPRMADYCYASISNWKVYHFHDTSDSAPVKLTGELHDNTYLRPDASNLAAYLFKLKHRYKETYDDIRSNVQLAIPFFDDFVLKPVESRPNDIQLRWQQKDSDYTFLASQLSDGSLRFICLVTALMQPDPPATIVLDEPEIGLHPHAISLLGTLMDLASEDMQIIVATQSVPLLNEFEIGNLIVVEREDGVSIFRRLDEKKFERWLQDYTVGELWENNILGGRLPA